MEVTEVRWVERTRWSSQGGLQVYEYEEKKSETSDPFSGPEQEKYRKHNVGVLKVRNGDDRGEVGGTNSVGESVWM